jgi:hypothetical protein
MEAWEFDLPVRGEMGEQDSVGVLVECELVSLSVKIASETVLLERCRLLTVDMDENLECDMELAEVKDDRLLWLSDNLCLGWSISISESCGYASSVNGPR